MKNVTIRLRILGAFTVMLLVLCTLGSFIYLRLDHVERQALVVKDDAIPGMRQSNLIKNALSADFLTVANQTVASDPAVKRRGEQAVEDQRAKIDRAIVEYEPTIFVDADRQLFTKFKEVYARYITRRAALLANPPDVTNSMEVQKRFETDFNPYHKEVIDAIDALADGNHARGIVAATQVEEESRSLLAVIVGGFALVFCCIFAGGLFLLKKITAPLQRLTAIMDVMRQGDFTQRMEIEQRDELGDLADGFNRMADEVMGLVGQVQKSGIRVSTSMTEIAATSKQQQATASEVAATTTQIGATSREISATSRELVRTMNEVSSVAEHAAGLAGSGQTGLSHMEETMGEVMEAASSINAKLAVLNEKAGNINHVVTTITKVADQTNLLSLNAAIEAEKAGEYGRGFAVVSSEIRRLADQTAIATYDIEQMVKEIQSAVSAGVMGMDKFSEQVRRGMHDIHETGGKLSEIIAQVQALVPRFETVNEGMQAQATGAEQISEALVQLTESTQQTVELLRQSSSAIDELNQVSGNLHGSISRFRLAA